MNTKELYEKLLLIKDLDRGILLLKENPSLIGPDIIFNLGRASDNSLSHGKGGQAVILSRWALEGAKILKEDHLFRRALLSFINGNLALSPGYFLRGKEELAKLEKQAKSFRDTLCWVIVCNNLAVLYFKEGQKGTALDMINNSLMALNNLKNPSLVKKVEENFSVISSGGTGEKLFLAGGFFAVPVNDKKSEPEESEPQIKFCPNCAAKIRKRTKFCGQCGKALPLPKKKKAALQPHTFLSSPGPGKEIKRRTQRKVIWKTYRSPSNTFYIKTPENWHVQPIMEPVGRAFEISCGVFSDFSQTMGCIIYPPIVFFTPNSQAAMNNMFFMQTTGMSLPGLNISPYLRPDMFLRQMVPNIIGKPTVKIYPPGEIERKVEGGNTSFFVVAPVEVYG